MTEEHKSEYDWLWKKIHKKLYKRLNFHHTDKWYVHKPNICLCLPPDSTWPKVNDPKVDYNGDLGEGKVGNEPMLEPCWTLLVIGLLSAMWVWWASLDIDPNLVPDTYAWLELKLEYGVQCYTRVTKMSMMQLAHPKVAQPVSSLPWSIGRLARMPDSPLNSQRKYGMCTNPNRSEKNKITKFSGT